MRPLISTALLCTLLPVTSWAGDLTVKIDRVKNDQGSILGALYDSEASFMKQPAARATFKVKAMPGEVQYVFHDIPAGTYALSIFHDENGNGQLDKNFLGIPKEGYGFSNDSKGSGGPPRFTQAAFKMGGANQTITIQLRY